MQKHNTPISTNHIRPEISQVKQGQESPLVHVSLASEHGGAEARSPAMTRCPPLLPRPLTEPSLFNLYSPLNTLTLIKEVFSNALGWTL